jgi:hypothetical protein
MDPKELSAILHSADHFYLNPLLIKVNRTCNCNHRLLCLMFLVKVYKTLAEYFCGVFGTPDRREFSSMDAESTVTTGHGPLSWHANKLILQSCRPGPAQCICALSISPHSWTPRIWIWKSLPPITVCCCTQYSSNAAAASDLRQ